MDIVFALVGWVILIVLCVLLSTVIDYWAVPVAIIAGLAYGYFVLGPALFG